METEGDVMQGCHIFAFPFCRRPFGHFVYQTQCFFGQGVVRAFYDSGGGNFAVLFYNTLNHDFALKVVINHLLGIFNVVGKPCFEG